MASRDGKSKEDANRWSERHEKATAKRNRV